MATERKAAQPLRYGSITDRPAVSGGAEYGESGVAIFALLRDLAGGEINVGGFTGIVLTEDQTLWREK